jgi:hypothetical protein
MKKCSSTLAIKEIHIKTTLRFYSTPIRIATSTTPKTTNIGENARGKMYPHKLLVGM